MSLQQKLRLYTKRRRTDAMPGWPAELVTAVQEYAQAERDCEPDRDVKRAELWGQLHQCAHSSLIEPMAEGTNAETFSVANKKVYKRLYDDTEWPDLVVEALVQALVHKAVPFATPHACICKEAGGQLFLVTDRLDTTLRAVVDTMPLASALDVMAQITVIYLALDESPDVAAVQHLDLHAGNIMCSLAPEPVTHTVAGVSYTSLTRAQWQIIDWGDAGLKTPYVELGVGYLQEDPTEQVLGFCEFAFPTYSSNIKALARTFAAIRASQEGQRERLKRLLCALKAFRAAAEGGGVVLPDPSPLAHTLDL